MEPAPRPGPTREGEEQSGASSARERSEQQAYPTKNRSERGEGFAGAHPEFSAYVDGQIAERRRAAEPPDDFVTRLIRTEVDGETLTDTEIRTLIVFLLVAGNETTRNLIGNFLVTMAQDPSLFRRLQDEPELVPIAVEESLRLDPPTAVLLRGCIRDTEVHGVPIRAGEKVAFGIASANRDEAHFEDPDTFRLDRPDPRAHVAFGGGPHVCPGSMLARLEARVAIEVFLDKVAEMKLAADFVRVKVPVFWANGPDTLQLRSSAAEDRRSPTSAGAAPTDPPRHRRGRGRRASGRLR
jgi:cytochrome P450